MIRWMMWAPIIFAAGCATSAPVAVRIATFQIDATPPIGSALCDGLVEPAATIDDPLSCRGMVVLTDQRPIVLCVLDWVGIGNGGHDAWRAALAEAAGTTPDRVAVHATHAHDAPGCDFDAESLLASHGLSGAAFDPAFARRTMAAASAAVREALKNPQAVTHIGYGKAKVDQVASTRRVLGPNGRVKSVRYSATRDPAVRQEPVGLIDPYVRMISWWHGDRPVAAMSYYACHPQSHYGRGAVSCDFPGVARDAFQRQVGVPLLHFNGAGGDVTAGKYNDGEPGNRAVLARRLQDGMVEAWGKSRRLALRADEVSWAVRSAALPPASNLDEQELVAILAHPAEPVRARVNAARDLVWLRHCREGRAIDVSCLAAGPVRVLHLPGELFVEYQLAAQQARPDLFVAAAAYGDYGMGYIGTRIAYSQGGYEVQRGISLVDPSVEDVLMPVIKSLLQP